jgi:predicted permease
MLERTIKEAGYAFRRLKMTPTFTATTVVLLALGIGGMTCVFSLVNLLLLKPLSVQRPDQLYRVGKDVHCCDMGGYSQEGEFSIFSYELYRLFQTNTPGFVELAAFQSGQSSVAVRRTNSNDIVHSYPSEFVSGNYFTLFGVRAVFGRMLIPSDDLEGAVPVAVISYRLWEHYGRDPALIGSTVVLNTRPFIVVGVTPEEFWGDSLRIPAPDFFLPLATEPAVLGSDSILHRPADHWLNLMGRLRPETNILSVETQMRVELKRWLRSHWADMDDHERAGFPNQLLFLSSGRSGIPNMHQKYQRWVHILMLISTIAMLFVNVNVATLILRRSVEQRQKVSISISLGATSYDIVRQALVETALLSFAGGFMGLVIATCGTRVVMHYAFTLSDGSGSMPSSLPSPAIFVFAFVLSVITAITCGIAPAWLSTKVNPAEALRGANTSTKRSGAVVRNSLVILEASLALVLLSASGVLMVGLLKLESKDLGFAQDRRMILRIDPQVAGYTAENISLLYQQLRDSLLNIPGVSSVAACTYSPQNGDAWFDPIYIGPPVPASKEGALSLVERVSDGYFEATGDQIIAGRGISEQDTARSPHVAVINEAFARAFFGSDDPIGKHVGRLDSHAARLYEIVGVAKNARYLSSELEGPVSPILFLPEVQFDVFPKKEDTEGDISSHFLHDIIVVLRPGGHLSAESVRRVMSSVDPNLPLSSLISLPEQVSKQLRGQRIVARLASIAAILSLALACVGIYGITAYDAIQRINEMAIRIALGATRVDTLLLLLQNAIRLVVLGLILGLILSAAETRFLSAQVYVSSAENLGILSAAIVVLGSCCLTASLLSAFRATTRCLSEALRIR